MPGGVELSNLDKVFWPDLGLTKGDLLAYVDAMSPFILPELRDRPLTVIRFPDGLAGPSFYQKNTPKYAPDWVRKVRLGADTPRGHVDYTVCNSVRTLRWLANQAAIELHPWTSRVDRIERPDHLVFDMDPQPGRFDMAVEAAQGLKRLLDEMGMAGVAKTSGAKGVHVYVPLIRKYRFDQVRAAAVALGTRLTAEAPNLATMEFRLKDRHGRVYIDAGRNGPGAHVVAPYSPRARPAATVSFPVDWAELDRIRPEEFSLRTVPAILASSGGRDRWRDLMPDRQTFAPPLRRALGY